MTPTTHLPRNGGIDAMLDGGRAPLAAILAPLTPLVCTALWARDDPVLFGGGSVPARD